MRTLSVPIYVARKQRCCAMGVAIEMSNHSRKCSFNWLASLIVICSQDVTQLHKQDPAQTTKASATQDGKLYVVEFQLVR